LIIGFTEVKNMKIKVIFCLILLLTSCSQNIPQETENQSIPVLEISPTPNSAAENNSNPSNVALKAGIPDFPFPEPDNESWKQKSRKYLIESSKISHLAVLEKSTIPKDDLEVRIWQDSGWWDANIFILKRSSGKWTANLQKQTYQEDTLKLKSVSKIKLNEPKSGWENVWEELVAEEILTLPDGFENGGALPCPDCGSYSIETNVGGNYRFCLYTTPSFQSNLRERRQVAKIADIIAEEFNLPNFKTFQTLPVE
jgi:hypothetical protein